MGITELDSFSTSNNPSQRKPKQPTSSSEDEVDSTSNSLPGYPTERVWLHQDNPAIWTVIYGPTD